MRSATKVFAMLALSALALPGCVSMPTSAKVDVVEPTSARPVVVAPPTVNNGAIFQASQYRPLFEDHRARLVGDTITVQIVENVNATASSTSSMEKSGTVSGSVSAIPFFGNSSILGKLGAGGTSSNVSAGKGGTQNTNAFTGTITATVIEVLPNGHLIVAGEKQIGVNHNADVLRFSGQIDPRVVQPGNTVASAQIANVRVEQRGRGAVGDAQQTGWLARFFLSVLPI